MSTSRETFLLPHAAPLTWPLRDPSPDHLALFLARARAVLATWRIECDLLECEAVLLREGLPLLARWLGKCEVRAEDDGWRAQAILSGVGNGRRDAVVRLEGYAEEAEGMVRQAIAVDDYMRFRLHHLGSHR